MKFNLFHVLAFAGALFVASCADTTKPIAVDSSTPIPASPGATQDQRADDGRDAPRISLADAKKEFDAGTAVIIDVRDVNAYKQEHIKGALNITQSDLATSMDKIPKGKKIIAYCS